MSLPSLITLATTTASFIFRLAVIQNLASQPYKNYTATSEICLFLIRIILLEYFYFFGPFCQTIFIWSVCHLRVYSLSVIVLSKSGSVHKVAILNGYTFYMHRQTKTTVTWRCSKCSARVIVQSDTGQVLRVNANHTHDPPTNYRIIDGVYHRLF